MTDAEKRELREMFREVVREELRFYDLERRSREQSDRIDALNASLEKEKEERATGSFSFIDREKKEKKNE